MKKRDYVNNRYLSSDTEYKVSKTKNKKAKPAWEIQCKTIITMPSRGKSILYQLSLPTTAQSPTPKSLVSPPTNRAGTILMIRVVSTRKVSRSRYRGIHIRYSSAVSRNQLRPATAGNSRRLPWQPIRAEFPGSPRVPLRM